ncbi:hypothetical protein FKM82_029902 [Ascaphus truei]
MEASPFNSLLLQPNSFNGLQSQGGTDPSGNVMSGKVGVSLPTSAVRIYSASPQRRDGRRRTEGPPPLKVSCRVPACRVSRGQGARWLKAQCSVGCAVVHACRDLPHPH